MEKRQPIYIYYDGQRLQYTTNESDTNGRRYVAFSYPYPVTLDDMGEVYRIVALHDTVHNFLKYGKLVYPTDGETQRNADIELAS